MRERKEEVEVGRGEEDSLREGGGNEGRSEGGREVGGGGVRKGRSQARSEREGEGGRSGRNYSLCVPY